MEYTCLLFFENRENVRRCKRIDNYFIMFNKWNQDVLVVFVVEHLVAMWKC